MKKAIRFLMGLLFVTLVTGCAEPIVKTEGGISAGVDITKYRKIAIVDFTIITGSDRASFLFHDALYTQLKRLNYDVLGRIATNRKIKNTGIPTNFATFSQNIRQIGMILKADAVFGGTISSIPLTDEEIFHNVTTSMSLMDTTNGFSVWFGTGSCKNGTLKGCLKRIAKSSLKKFPRARR